MIAMQQQTKSRRRCSSAGCSWCNVVTQARIDELANRLAMPPASFAENLEQGFLKNEVQNQPSFPVEQAELHVSEVWLSGPPVHSHS